MTLSAGMRLGPYRVLEKLGAGGMGEVYRARDSRLERDVALKVLPAATLGDETARARLVREARLASRLNHPHICTIYDVGETDVSGDSSGSPEAGSGPRSAYIAMELVEGQPLSARVAEGPLPTDQVVRYGQQLADALAHAHARGVVHRDFKSGNVVVTPEGQVKVLDFGLAKRLTEEALAEATTVAHESLTAPGIVAGTLAYMAPEQLRGRPADARSDIWALGVVLYEMAAGRRPFEGQTGFELTAAIFNKPVPPMPGPVPEPVAGVVERCLAKEPGERYQRAGEVKAALEAVASGRDVARWPTWRMAVWRRRRLLGRATAAVAVLLVAAALVTLDVGGVRSRVMGSADPIRLAVLPFSNLTGDPEQEYLSDGFAEEIRIQLGRLHPAGLEVVGRMSVMRYKKGDTPPDQIGRELDVDYVLEGTLQQEAGRVKISPALIKVAGQTQLWAYSYVRELSGMLALQNEVAREVAGALALKLLPAEQASLASPSAVNPEAYDAYQKGSYHWKKLTPADADTAQRYFELALEKDPSYAAAYEGLAWVWVVRGQMGMTLPQVAGPKAKAAALQALKLDDRYAGAHEALAVVLTATDWDWAGAEREYRRALDLNPSLANAHAYYSNFLAIRGRTDEAVRHVKQALTLDPFNALFHGVHAWVLTYQRRFDESIAAARAALAIDPNSEIGANNLQRAFIMKGMRDEHLAIQRQLFAKDPALVAALEQGLAEGGYVGAQRRLGDVLAARYEIAGGVPTPGPSRVYSLTWIAFYYVAAGEYSRAFDWLEKAEAVRDPNLIYLGQPLYDPLRSDPRFQALLRRVGLPQ